MIPVNEPLLTEADYASVMDALRSGWISGAGPHVEAFESRWAAYCGRKHGIALANGTVALQVAVALLDLQPGDEVIMPTFTIISCALPVVLAGATPVLVDSEPQTWTMNVDQVEARISSRTRALMPVHIYGHPVDMDPLLDLAERYNLPVIEDAAEAHGAEYRGRRAGSFGTSSCFSFYANKLVTTGEGGMLLVDDDGLAERARRMRNLGLSAGSALPARGARLQFPAHEPAGRPRADPGRPYRRDRRTQTPHGPGVYRATLRNGGSHAPGPTAVGQKRVLDVRPGRRRGNGIDAAEFGRRLASLGVETRPFFLGMHEQPVLQDRGLFAGESYPVAERIARQGLYLPSGLGLDESQIERVCQAVGEALG